jgi:hypothetical protein
LRGDEDSDDADVMGDFSASCVLKIDSNFDLKVDFNLNSKQLEKLVSKQIAVFACEVMCSKTAYRNVWTSFQNKLEIQIDTSLLRDQVVLDFYIVANQKFEYIENGGWHPDYDGRAFSIPKGAVLAYGGQRKEQVERESSDSSTGGSLIAVEPSNKEKGPFEVDLNSDRMTIYVPTETYNLFEKLYKHNPSYAPIFHSSLVVPALVEAITAMCESQEYQEKKWYQAIDTKYSNDSSLQKIEMNQRNALPLAQTLVKFPFSEVTFALAKDTNSESED